MRQSNTRVGDIRVLAGESLVGLEGRLAECGAEAATV